MSGVFSVNTIVTVFGVKLKTIPKTVVVFLQAFLSASARSWRRNCPRLEADVAYFNSLQREAGDPIPIYMNGKTGRFQSTPARSRRRQLLPISIYILHISLYKSTNVLYSPPHSSTNPPIKMRFFQCESPKELMSTYVSHHQSAISL